MWWIPWWTREKWWEKKRSMVCCWKGLGVELNFCVDLLYGLVILVLWVVVLQTIFRLPLSLFYETFVYILCNKSGRMLKDDDGEIRFDMFLWGDWQDRNSRKIHTKWNDIKIIVVMGSLGRLSMLDVWYHRNGVYIKRWTLSFLSSNLVDLMLGRC
jgi:hypothetical protein